jgi:hypothetical protein
MRKVDLILFSSIDYSTPLNFILYCDIVSYVVISDRYELVPLTRQYLVSMQSTRLKEICGFRPQANYTDRATAACRRVCANFRG